jgi:hypothetical protein
LKKTPDEQRMISDVILQRNLDPSFLLFSDVLFKSLLKIPTRIKTRTATAGIIKNKSR